MGGDSAYIIRQIHEKYGNVVRIGPNDLSFNTPEATRDIYYHVVNGRPRLLKSAGYERPETPSIATVRDPDEHRRQRAAVAQIFSLKAVRSKQHLVKPYIDKFIEEIGRLGTVPEGIEMVQAFNWVAFDIIGQLTFSKDFGALEHNRSTQSWIKLQFGGVLWGLMPDFFVRMPILRYIWPLYLPWDIAQKRRIHTKLTREEVQKRMRTGSSSWTGDFFDQFIKRGDVSEDEAVSQAMILLAAGSGTVQTTLSGCTYYLSKSPETLLRLQHEIRSAFESSEQINDESTSTLPYLHGVIQEALRLLPPVPSRLPRTSPGVTIDGHFVPQGTVVAANTYNMSRDPAYWADPDDFRPERWLKGAERDPKFALDNRDAMKPFSTGPRACMGGNLAYLEVRTILARLVFAFDWELLEQSMRWEQELKIFFLWKKPPLMVRFYARNDMASSA